MKAKKTNEKPSAAELQKQLDETTVQLQKLQLGADIEAALELVRDRTMAMHHSDELRETVGVLFDQLKRLDFNLQQCSLTLIDEKRKEAESWQAADVQSVLPMSFRMSFIDHPIFDIMVEDGVFDKEGYTVTEYSGEQKKEFDDFVFNHTPLKHAPAHVLEFMFSHDKIVLCRAHMAYGFVEVVSNNEPLPQEKAGVLQRFAKVFEQTYTRFLDLQKAEAQAREAQIEAALERVRACTMAMYHSDELANAATILFHQLFELGIKPMACAFVILNPEDQTGEVWITSDGTVNSASFTHPYHTDPVQERIYQAWRAGKSYLVEDLQGDILREHLQFIAQNMPVQDLMEAAGNTAPERLVIHAIYFSHGFLGFNYEEPKEGDLKILGRFAKVFDQTYTRFLDLQKAEAQAREAHIEASLERVRASSMAMHKSTELPDVALVLVNQLAQLDIRQLGSSILIIDDKLETYRQYSAHDSLVDSNKILNIVEDLDLNALYLGKEILRLSRAGKKDFTIPLSGDHLQQWMLYTREKVHRERGDAMLKAGFECIYFHFAVFQDISQIVITTLMPLPEKDRRILRRMADTFGMSYRRYLDLQQAESQAREAEIQLALERVRARTMAMHNSEELSDVIAVVSEQLQQLKIRFDHVSFAINSDAEDYHFWTALYGKPRPYELKVPYLDNPIANRAKEVRSKGLKFYQDTLTPKENREWLEHAFKHNPTHYLSPEEKAYVLSRGFSRSFVIMPNIILNVGNYASQPYQDEDNEIIKRFATVFEQTYTRFLDLKKAEAQAREAQIEAALERIRAAAMAMHSSQGLADVTAVLREQLALLGQKELESCILALYDKGSDTYAAYYTYKKPNGDSQEFVQDKVTVPWKETAWSRTVIKHYLAGETHFSIHANHKMLREWYKMLARLAPETIEKNIQGKLIVPAELYYDFAAFSGGLLWMVAYNEPSQETSELLDRAAATFDIAYRRYLDLIKAEKQAREAHIEAALERVRGRTMAMHQSNELAETASLLFTQLNSLGIQPWSCGFNIWSRDMQFHDAWMSHPEGGILPPMQMPNHSIPVHKNILEAYTRKETLFIQELSGDDLLQHFQLLAKVPQVAEILAGLVDSGFQIPTHLVFYAVFFSEGFLFFQTEKRSAESIDLFVRFTKVFDQTYTRFLDLKKAEEQVREAQIEAALEKVRSRTMAMQKSDELLEVAEFIFIEFQQVGKDPFDISIFQLDHTSRTLYGWSAIPSEEGLSVFSYTLPPTDHPFIRTIFDQQLQQKTHEIYYLTGEEKISYDDFFFQAIPIPEMEEIFRSIESCYVNLIYNSTGGLVAITPEPLPSEELSLLHRFSKVVDLSYTRFLDLQKAETQAREAQIESALERVRAVSMSMHQSADLSKTAQALFHQLEILDIDTWAAGFNICNNYDTLVLAYTSLLGKLHSHAQVPHDQDPTLINVFKHWKNGCEFYSEEMGGSFLQIHYAYMKEIHKDAVVIEELETSGFTIPRFPTYQVYNAAYFKFGYLMFITFEVNPEHEIIFRRFAQVFEQAYIRFLDLKKTEEQAEKILQERNRLEMALKDLKAAQSQLIQAEKMASLGELTAGIAHEIQNPLNFVNNFSELNEELIEELNQELDLGNLSEAREIIKDLMNNEVKIKHHGKRAESIVKGMLQHSRTSSGERELTDINALCDEYFRLSYHGIRARDKSFNAKFEMNFDHAITKINVVPQDMGRVLLNLMNNAFYACAERSQSAVDERHKSSLGNYEPTVSISTKKIGDYIKICVKDNGDGIPDEVKGKIFQPFFTTKPTGQGTGLGLSLAYDIVKAHGGELVVETKEGEGSAFMIKLPVA